MRFTVEKGVAETLRIFSSKRNFTFFLDSQIVKATLRTATRGNVAEIQFAFGLFGSGIGFLLESSVLDAFQGFPSSPTLHSTVVTAFGIGTVRNLFGVLVIVRGTFRRSRSVICNGSKLRTSYESSRRTRSRGVRLPVVEPSLPSKLSILLLILGLASATCGLRAGLFGSL